MQLAKLMYMEAERTWQYKVKQMFLAIELEKRYSKEKILEFYLNNIYFANGYYGIDAACHGYFDCELSDLDLSQIAFLCAIPNSPTYYDPVENPDHTIERRDLILQNMRDDGKITETQYYEAVREEITLNRPETQDTELINNYVDTYTYYCATRALMEQQGFVFRYYFDSDEEKESYEEDYEELYNSCQQQLYAGGYKIYTSIDMEKQALLQQSVDDTLSGFTDTDDDGTYEMQASAVSVDNNTGYVVAIVGGRDQDFSTYTLNRAYQSHRQPGSSIKPLIVYTPQLERGYTPDSIVDDHKFDGGPSNASGSYAGKVTLRYAVAHSLNTVAWQLYDELTPEVGLQYLKNMNFSAIEDSDYTLATSLGGFTKGVSAVEMASAYATLENDGLYRQPTCIKSIVDDDENVVYASAMTEVQIYDQDAARTMTDVLTSVMDSGTGKNVKLKNMPCAGKTGTTNDHKDGWFCGYTRYYTTCVWVGCDYPKKISDLSGSTYPGTIWKTYMTAVHENLASMDFLPYAQLSDDFISQQEQEEQEHEQMREENKTDGDEEKTAGEEQPAEDDDKTDNTNKNKDKDKNKDNNKDKNNSDNSNNSNDNNNNNNNNADDVQQPAEQPAEEQQPAEEEGADDAGQPDDDGGADGGDDAGAGETPQ
jgi:membrane peptidoglycan carboxypeptidase